MSLGKIKWGSTAKKKSAGQGARAFPLIAKMRLGEDGVLASLREAELRLRAGRDLDRLTRRRIAAGARLALELEELAETREDDALRELRAIIGDLEQRLVRSNSLLLADAGGLRDGGHDFGLGRRNLLSHFLDPYFITSDALRDPFPCAVSNVPYFVVLRKGVNTILWGFTEAESTIR